MKKNIFIISIMLISMIFVSSCSKVEDSVQSSSPTDQRSIKMSQDMTNEEMEESILGFIDKLENPEGQSDMDIEEAFDYVEATLNYKYVNYDYSKCANTVEFTSSINISPDQNNMMTMGAISVAYDSILADWQQHYYSIEDNNKTPIVFDITDISSTEIKYTMIVGYGSLDIGYWANPTPPTSAVYFVQAANNYTNGITAQINNDQISRQPTGSRSYYVAIGGQYVTDPRNYPSGSNDNSLPGNNGYTDFLFYFSSADPNYQNFHLYLSVPPQLDEYGFYATQLGQYVTDYATNNGGNRVSYCKVYEAHLSDPSNQNIAEARHKVNFTFGREYYTQTNLSSL